jgi:hypothetical protein
LDLQTFNGSKITTLRNAYAPGTSVALTQGTSALQPLYVGGACNGKPALQFDATTYIKAAFTLAQPATVLLVARCDTFVASRNFFDGGAQDAMIGITSAGPKVGMYSGVGYANALSFTTGIWFAASFVFNGASSIMNLNGTAGAAADVGSGTPGGLSLGASPLGNFGLACTIARTCVYNVAFTAAQAAESVRRLQAQYRV